jgi:hypothetical protein
VSGFLGGLSKADLADMALLEAQDHLHSAQTLAEDPAVCRAIQQALADVQEALQSNVAGVR